MCFSVFNLLLFCKLINKKLKIIIKNYSKRALKNEKYLTKISLNTNYSF